MLLLYFEMPFVVVVVAIVVFCGAVDVVAWYHHFFH